MKIKRTTADALFSLYIRRRDKWTCQVCMKVFPPGEGKLDCSHYESRRHWATRHDPSNACAMCFVCHRKFEEDRRWACEWLDKRHGKFSMEALYIRAHATAKKSRSDEKMRVLALKQLLKELGDE